MDEMTSVTERDERPPPSEARRIGKYEIIRLLGKGAMGAVYHAHDPLLERDVALKVMLPQIADDPEHKQRFEREARAVARMMHPNVVTVFDLGYHTDGSPYIVMELLKGRDLLELVRDGPPLSLPARISIVLQVLEGLGHAHKVGIVHRDIKPANLFISEEGTTKITDFGIARITTTSVTAAGVVLGTAAYMSPEQVSGGKVDGRSDLFSVGCMLSELVTGRRPFEGKNAMATLFKIAHQDPVLEVPAGAEYEGLLPILVRSLAKSADERYATAADFAVALRDFLGRRSATRAAEPATAGATVSGAVPALPASPASAAPGTSPLGVLLPSGDPGPAARAGNPNTEAYSRPDPTPLFRLLREIYVRSKSGHLHFTHGQERRSLRLVSGQIIHGSSDVAGEHLGDVIVRYGLLSQADLDRAITVVLRDRKRLGAVLSELGLLDRERLEEAVGLHVRELLFNVLDRPGGSHVFEEAAEGLVEADLTSRLSTAEVIFEATRRVQDPELVSQALGDMNRVLVLSSSPLMQSQKLTLTPTDGFILSRIDGTLSAREVVSLIPLPPADTERSLFGLLCTGTVDYLPESARARSPLPASSARAGSPSP
jgi:serine/threonine protein kinase